MKEKNNDRRFKTRCLTESAMMIALATTVAFICSLIPVIPFNFPFGGGVTVASMLPIVLIAYLYGTPWGLLTAFCYSIIQMLLGHATIASLFLPIEDGGMQLSAALIICFLDYLLAYTSLGLGGLLRHRTNAKRGLLWGGVLALSLRYVCHVVSGTIFYGAWASWFFEQEGIYQIVGKAVLEKYQGGVLALIYSLIYNGCYMLPEILITALVSLIVARIPAVKKRMNI